MPLGDVYAFISSLYYRGKRAYARRFGRRSDAEAAVLVVTPSQGLLRDDAMVGMDDLRAFAATEIDPANPAYLEPLVSTARALERRGPPQAAGPSP